ncbi:uroporphyrinogen-III synthase [Planococcus sp. YIM B11945]|uniref:uroporphyrinogen-III synthase n=1 Tax=Planococcus sp. YIM B11945 TaxID=3435410 RepID=UPI003D7DF113
MCETSLPLKGQTIVFTGSTEPIGEMGQVEALGGQAIYMPLIETAIRQSDVPDFGRYEWLIFTSRTSAEAFCLLDAEVKSKIAAVGEKTAEVLTTHGFTVDFMPSVYSADVFVKEFPAIAGNARCLFVKGALAKNTIASMPMPVDEWVLYETALRLENAKKLLAIKDATVIFASPSAVSAYRKAGGAWQGIRVAAIGHVTQKAILDQAGHVDFVPEKYTLMNVLNEIAKGSCMNE